MPKRKSRDLQPILFIRPNVKDEGHLHQNKIKKDSHDSAKDGECVKHFYEDVVGIGQRTLESGTSSSHSEETRVTKPDLANIAKSVSADRSSGKCLTLDGPTNAAVNNTRVSSRTVHAYLKAAQEGNMKALVSFHKQGVPVDSVDAYGWTALMCAARAENVKAVKYLLESGASTTIFNKQGQTVRDIVKECKGSEIKVLLQCQEAVRSKSSSKDEKKVEEFYCDVCKCKFTDTSRKRHETSTVHLFNSKSSSKGTYYSIPETNKGYQLMLKSGWDKDKGLGSEGQGQKFPVKTLLKRDRQGLGTSTGAKPRVTHFGPGDEEAVKMPGRIEIGSVRKMRDSTVKKRDHFKTLKREKQKEKNFRLQFFME